MFSGVAFGGGKNAALNVKFTNGGCKQFAVEPCSGSKIRFRLQFVIVQNGLEAFENQFNLPTHTVEFQNLSGCDLFRQIGNNYNEFVVNRLQFRDFPPVFPGIGSLDAGGSFFNVFGGLSQSAYSDREIVFPLPVKHGKTKRFSLLPVFQFLRQVKADILPLLIAPVQVERFGLQTERALPDIACP